MIGATAYSPTPPGSSWWPVGPHAREPAGRGELGQRVVGGGVQQPQPVADLGDLVLRAGTGDHLAVGPQTEHRGAVQHHGQPRGHLGQAAAGERDLHELVVHAGGQRQRLALLGDDGTQHLGDDLVEADRRRQRQHRKSTALGLGEHLGRHGRRPLGAPVGQRGGAHRVQPLDQRPAVDRIGRREPGAEHHEDVDPRGGQRIGRVVDHHVPDRAPQAPGAGDHRRSGQPGEVQHVLDGESHALLPAPPLGPGRVGARRFLDRPVATKRHRSVTLCGRHRRGITLGHDASLSCRQRGRLVVEACQDSSNGDIHSWRVPP
jgi:hypothetical protein